MPSIEVLLPSATLGLVAAAIINRNLARVLVVLALLVGLALYVHGATRGLTLAQTISSISAPITEPLPTGGQIVKP